MNGTLKWLRRIGIAIGGGVVVFLGVCMLVLPGPGIVVIALGLGILSLEFAAPRRWLVLARAKANEVADKVRERRKKK
ncbi:MAG: PGPGW domain-containing protein [Steroidobacteraceae bacterium]